MNVLLGVTGGIAAYKSAYLVRLFIKQGHNVRVMMTKHALDFVGKVTFEALSHYPVICDNDTHAALTHIEVAKWADVCVIAPATANVIGKMACGIADDVVSTIILAVKTPIVITPAMNCDMYTNAAVIENLYKLKSRGVEVIEPLEGELACGDLGKGKMQEPEIIAKYINDLAIVLGKSGDKNKHRTASLLIEDPADIKKPLDDDKVKKMIDSFKEQSVSEYLDEPFAEDDDIEGSVSQKPLEGLRILITAGPTREYLDPVRYITNRSSGKMGYALAEEAQKMGADVTLISGKTYLQSVIADTIITETSEEMYTAVTERAKNYDIIIMSAAVADYTPIEKSNEKIKKSSKSITLELTKTTDILLETGKLKRDNQVLVGFAAETENVESNALWKLKAKNLDMIAANDVSKEGIGFDSDMNEMMLYFKDGSSAATGKAPKKHIAKIILTESAIIYNQKTDETNKANS